MFISYRWLSRHVDLTGISPEDVARDLTLSTCEVEGLEPFAPHLSAVTVGLVEERKPHPDADKLSVCTVDVGAAEKLQIVCGAPNVDGGQKVAVATVGTVLPGDFKIKKSKIRGVESRGMICSVRELDLGDEHDGIWVLSTEAPVGQPVAEALDMLDWVIEVDNKSLTHRPDLWGHRGLAAELAAIYRRELKPITETLPETGPGEPYPVRITSAGCSRYIGIPIDGVRSGPSPEWLRNLLLAVGQRPIDLLVDISNFVMLDLGQPNHLFDRTALSPEGILVRDARAGEVMQTLDGFDRKLTEADMLICSGDEPVALAGVMGGEGSKVIGDTSSLLLEVASFHPTTVRRTSARLGLRTDASARFEKSLDPTLPMKAAAHMVSLLKELQPELSLPTPIGDAGDWKDPALTIELRADRVRLLLGAALPDEEIADILTRLGFGLTARGAGVWEVAVPSARATKDVTIEQDLVEEVGRIYRYGNVPEQAQVVTLEPPIVDERRELVRALQDRLSGAAHFHEIMSYSFLTDGEVRRQGIEGEAYVQVINPVAEGLSRVRRSVTPSLLTALSAARRHREDLRLYEIGKGYLPVAGSEEPAEVHQLALLVAAPAPGKKARFDAGAFPRLVGVLEDLLTSCGFGAPRLDRPDEEVAWPSWANAGRAVRVLSPEGAELGCLAELEPGVGSALGLTGELASEVAVCELSLDQLLLAGKAPFEYRPIPRFPGVKVDVAFALPDSTPAGDARAAIERAGKGLVQRAQLFDVYAGENLGAGRKSLAYHVDLLSGSRTLNDKDIQKFLDRVGREAEKLGGELRRE